MMDAKELIGRCIKMNSRRTAHGEAQKQNILIRDLKNYTRIKEELSSCYKIIELDASEIIFYRITPAQGSEYCKVDYGPETEKRVMRTTDFASCCDIEKPVVFYEYGSFICEMNSFLQTVFKTENALVVIKNIDKISNPANRHVFVRFLWSHESLPALPFIVLLDNVDKQVHAEIITDSKDTLFEIAID